MVKEIFFFCGVHCQKSFKLIEKGEGIICFCGGAITINYIIFGGGGRWGHLQSYVKKNSFI